MRRTVVMLNVLILLVGQGARAEGPESSTDRATQMALKLKESLSLSKRQTARVTEILTHSRECAAQDRLSFEGDREALVKAKWERIDATDRQIEAILTLKQMERYREVKREFRERFRERMKERIAENQ